MFTYLYLLSYPDVSAILKIEFRWKHTEATIPTLRIRYDATQLPNSPKSYTFISIISFQKYTLNIQIYGKTFLFRTNELKKFCHPPFFPSPSPFSSPWWFMKFPAHHRSSDGKKKVISPSNNKWWFSRIHSKPGCAIVFPRLMIHYVHIFECLIAQPETHVNGVIWYI